MNRQPVYTSNRVFWACIPLLLLLFCTQVTAATTKTLSPKPGGYCPGTDILLVTAEELSASLDLTMRSRAAMIDKDYATAISELISARTTLHLAASRGAAARTIQLIDAVLKAKTGDNYDQMLAWFPVLQTNLLTLPNDATVGAADDYIGNAEDIMQGDRNGNPEKLLKDARHMLACNDLDIPLHEAMQAQDNLMKKMSKNTKSTAYDSLLDSLRRALVYALRKSEL